MENTVLRNSLDLLPASLRWTLEGSHLPAILPKWLEMAEGVTFRETAGATWEDAAHMSSDERVARLRRSIPASLAGWARDSCMSSDLRRAAWIVRAWDVSEYLIGVRWRSAVNAYTDAMIGPEMSTVLESAYHHGRELHAWLLGRASMREAVWDLVGAVGVSLQEWPDHPDALTAAIRAAAGYREAGAAMEAGKAAILIGNRGLWEAAIARMCVGFGVVLDAHRSHDKTRTGVTAEPCDDAPSRWWRFSEGEHAARLRGYACPFVEDFESARSVEPSRADLEARDRADRFAGGIAARLYETVWCGE